MEIDYIVIENRDSAKNADVIEVLDKVLAHNVSPAVWDWEFNTNKHAVFTIAKEGDTIAGTQSMLPVVLSVCGNKMATAKSETSYLFSEYRGRGIFEKLYLLATEATQKNGTEIIWGFTPAVKAWRNNLKFEVRERLVSHIVLSTHNYSYGHLSAKSKNPIVNFGRFLKTRSKHRGFLNFCNSLSFDKTIAVKEEINTMQDFELLHSKIDSLHNNIIRLDFNNEYYQWRVLNNPVLNYRKLFFYKDYTLVGYILYTHKGQTISIADITFNMETPVLETMFKHLADREHAAHYFYYWGNPESVVNEQIFNLLERAGGILTEDDGRNFVFRQCSGSGEIRALSDMRNWYINGLWTEGFDI